MSEKWTAEKALGELLAVIHRDGGHYQLKYGITKATEDAIDIIYKLRKREQNAGEAVAWLYDHAFDPSVTLADKSGRAGWVPLYTRPAQQVSVPDGWFRAAYRVASYLDHANMDTSKLPEGMGDDLRALYAALEVSHAPTASAPTAPAGGKPSKVECRECDGEGFTYDDDDDGESEIACMPCGGRGLVDAATAGDGGSHEG